MNNDELLQQIRNAVKEEIKLETEPIKKQLDQQSKDIADVKKDISNVKQEQNHTATALDSLKAGIDDIREKMVTKADFTQLEEKIDATKAEVDTIKKQLRPRHAD